MSSELVKIRSGYINLKSEKANFWAGPSPKRPIGPKKSPSGPKRTNFGPD